MNRNKYFPPHVAFVRILFITATENEPKIPPIQQVLLGGGAFGGDQIMRADRYEWEECLIKGIQGSLLSF